MKNRALVALLSHFVILGLLVPFLAYGKGEEITRIPQEIRTGNSQTMRLLEASLNINPTGTGGAEITIADDVALEATGNNGRAFVEGGKSGNGQISVYIVRKGDTLSEIADMFGVSTNTIVWANSISGGKIRIGQELVILPISGVRHMVKFGDTLKSVTLKYKADLDDILLYNSLASDTKLKVGDEIIIPDGVVSSTQSAIAGSNQVNVTSGYYMRPVSGKKSQGIHGYNGIDIAASIGTPIWASAAGTVIISRTSGYNGGYGLYVAIKHDNGTQTVYGHMSKVSVSVGERVERGEVIGAVGNTGRSTGPHLHFEVRGAKNPF